MRAPDAPPSDGPAVTALIAEDEPVLRTLLEHIAAAADLECIVAEDGEEAWRVLESLDAPVLILVDWMMPGVSGIELCRRARAKSWRVEPYVIMVTGRTKLDDVVEGLEAGANDYVRKPVDLAELRARIQVGLSNIRLRVELDRQLGVLAHALEHVRTLQGIIPICSYCHKIRDDEQAWHRLEAYVSRHTEAELSHGICPDCLRERFPETEGG